MRCLNACVHRRLEQPGRLQAVLSELIDFGPAPKVLLDYTTEMLAEIEEMERKSICFGSLASNVVVVVDAERIVSALAEEASGRLWKSVRGATGGSEWVLESSIVSDRRGEGAKRLVAIIHTLSTPHLDRLLRYIRDWNTQSKHNLFAQQVCDIVFCRLLLLNLCMMRSSCEQLLYCILRAFPASKLKACPSFTDVVKGALPYSERHFEVRSARPSELDVCCVFNCVMLSSQLSRIVCLRHRLSLAWSLQLL